MNSIYEEVLAAIHSVWSRRWLALAVAWGVALLGWLVVAMVPNSYESRARIFVQLDDALAEQIGIGLGNRKRDIDRVQQTLTSAVNLEKVIRSTKLGDDITTPKQMESTVLGLAKAIKVLRARLFDWIADPDLRPFVAGYARAHPRHGGEGATYIFLRASR